MIPAVYAVFLSAARRLATRALMVRYQARLADDQHNIAALQRQLGCTHAQADALYRVARVEGYGAAYREVFR